MPIEKIHIEKFLELSKNHPVLDVRSPGEFKHAHLPGAYTLPLFTDEERKVVGTTYKQEGRQSAILTGLDMFGGKMRKMVEEVSAIAGEHSIILVHCWRGGMRSAGVAWLLDLYGFKVYTLIGGYKSFRRWSLDQFDKPYEFRILGGYTGSGKTLILEELESKGHEVINLEKIANHKGSAFGALGEDPQPSQEMFENLLATKLYNKTLAWVEDESQRVGRLLIPHPVWNTMRSSQVYFLDIPFEARLDYITKGYGSFDKDQLLDSISRIQRRLGGLEAKTASNFLIDGDVKESFRILLSYYDKLYKKGLYNRNEVESLLHMIPCETVDTDKNLGRLPLLQMDHQNTT